MNLVTTAFRDLTCVVAAAVITLLIGAAFVQSTSAAPGTQTQIHSLARTASPAPLYT
jgi:hypothetical protein